MLWTFEYTAVIRTFYRCPEHRGCHEISWLLQVFCLVNFQVTKILLHKTLIRLVVSYGAEAWTMTKKDEQALLVFERKIFRRVYGPK